MDPNEIRTDFPFATTEHEDWRIALSDGCTLSARVWMPEGDGPFPAILEFLPYRKRDGTSVRDQLTHPYFAGHGYACFRVDMRGSGESEGLMADEYTQQELDDAVEVISYIASQDWSNGRVGMMGISWGGFNSLQVAAMDPAPLKAIVTLCSTVDRYADDIHYKGGCLLNENLGWGATMWSYSSRPPDPALRPDWRKIWLERLEAEPFLPALWLEHQNRDDYWRHGSVCENYAAIKAATLAVGGWGDAYKNAVGALVENLQAPVKGIIGPWVHKYPHFASPEPRIGFLDEALCWWDRWLRDTDTGVEKDPGLRLYVMEGEKPKPWYEKRTGRWIGIDRYPEPTEKLAFTNLPAPLASPQNTGAQSGEYCAIWLGPEMPGDQREDDALSLCVDGKPVQTPVDLAGRARFHFTIAAPKAGGKIAVRLCDVAPDGASARITYGVLNLAQLKFSKGRISGNMELDAIAYQLPAGHRLRLAVSSAYWPLIWPAPEAVELTLLEGYVELPLVDAANCSDGVSFPPPRYAPPLPQEEIRPPAHIRRTDPDPQNGTQKLVIEDDFGKYRNGLHGLVHGSVAREKWSIHPDDPLSARGECHWTQEIERDGICLRTETYCEMWSDASNFHLNARLEAFENDSPVYEKSGDFKIPRDGQ